MQHVSKEFILPAILAVLIGATLFVCFSEKPHKEQTEPVALKPSESSKTEPNDGLLVEESKKIVEVAKETRSKDIVVGEAHVEDAVVVSDEDAERLTAELRQAIQANNDQEGGDVLDRLVKLGDNSITQLADLLRNDSNETVALYAAKGLAMIGTPTAAKELLEVLPKIPDGDFKNEVAMQVASIRTQESWPVLLDSILKTEDTAVLRATSFAFSHIADNELVDEIVRRYDESGTKSEMGDMTKTEPQEQAECQTCGTTNDSVQNRLARVIRNIRKPKATEALIAYAGQIDSSPSDPVEGASIYALSQIGTPEAVNYLLQRLESVPADEYIFKAVTQINNEKSRLFLIDVAQGNNEITSDKTRSAAIYALGNFHDEEVRNLLERLSVEPVIESSAETDGQTSTIVSTAAKVTLERMQGISVANNDSEDESSVGKKI